MASPPATYEEEEWTAEDACIVWRLDPLTGNHAPVLDFPYKVKMTGELEVTVRAAKDIVFTRIGGGQRVIAELKLGSLKRTTEAAKFDKNLVTWEQKVDPLTITSETENLRVSVFHHSKHFAHAKMGSAYVPLSDLNNLMVIVKDTVGEELPAGESKSLSLPKSLRNEPTEQNPVPYFRFAVQADDRPFVIETGITKPFSREVLPHRAVNGRSIAAGTLFWVVERLEKTDEGTTVNDGRNTFLRLADNAGWLFTTHQKDGRTIVRPSMQAKEETAKEKQYNLIKQCQTWVEIINGKGKAVGKVLLFCKLYIGSEREAIAGDAKTSKKIWKKIKRSKKKKEHKLFGGLLANTVDSSSGEEIPKVCRELIEFLRKNGLTTEGLFRVPGHHAEMKKIQDAYEKGELCELKEVHDAAGVLKKFFRDLKEPIIPASHNSSVLEIAENREAKAAKNEKYKFLISTLPNINKAVLAFLISFLYELSTYSEKNKMTVKNIAVVWAPNLFSSSCMQFSQMIHAVEILIGNSISIFGAAVVEDTSGMRTLKMKRKHKRSQSSRSYNLYNSMGTKTGPERGKEDMQEAAVKAFAAGFSSENRDTATNLGSLKSNSEELDSLKSNAGTTLNPSPKLERT